MFDFLKKKIGGFIDGLTKKKEDEIEEKPPEEKIEKELKTEEQRVKPKKQIEKPVEKKKEPIKATVEKKEKPISKKIEEKPPDKVGEKPISKIEEKPVKKIIQREPINEKIEPKEKKPEIKPEQKIEIIDEPKPHKIEQPKVQEKTIELPKKEEKPKERIKLGIVSTVKSIITREVEISESDVKQMLEEFELELLEADVDIGVAESIKNELTEKIVGAKIPKNKLQSFVSDSIKQILIEILTNDKDFDILEKMQSSDKPVKIMLIGINGAGKTTTIAKVAKLLMDNKQKVVFAAADTFRAAAIEQMSIHADRLGVKIIKREYGSDPTSVAYDAVNYAKAHAIDAVLIDTAGRQDTNISLINEVKKMTRVIQPDLKIYIGESIAGNAIIDQISTFNKEIGIDAVILTKLDCDPKGGTMLSINKATGIPIIYVGIGQKYEDLERFIPEKIVGNIVG